MVRRYRAPRHLVWEVWTDPKHIIAWWGPFGPDETSAAIDLTVGGLFLVAMCAPDGTEHLSRGIIQEIIPHEKIVLAGDLEARDACGAGLPPGSIITVTFADTEDGTQLTLRTEFPSPQARADAEASRFASNWAKILDDLPLYLHRAANDSLV